MRTPTRLALRACVATAYGESFSFYVVVPQAYLQGTLFFVRRVFWYFVYANSLGKAQPPSAPHGRMTTLISWLGVLSENPISGKLAELRYILAQMNKHRD
jgi:hypothetical protein